MAQPVSHAGQMVVESPALRADRRESPLWRIDPPVRAIEGKGQVKGGSRVDDDANGGRWGRRQGLARGVRVLVFLAPVAASIGSAALVRPLLPPAVGLWGHLGYLLALVAVSTVTLLAVDRLARRALPLATLLDLSMLFPDGAPSRLKVARAAIKRAPIEEQLARVARAGADPGAVAREILTLVAALSAHDRPTRGHAERVRMFTDLLAEELRIPQRDRDLLRWAAILHDVGKLRVPVDLLNKPGKPTPEEWDVLKAHPTHGAEIADALLPWLGDWGSVIAQHHERYDGTGYPLGLGGRQISLGARIVSVADAFDVMTAARAYKRPISRAAAHRELVKFSGSQFDPVVVRAMLSVGAPRLRRAQGVLAWLSDIPLVASASVPAATVARVVGASALATGAVAGGVGVGVVSEPTPLAHAATTTDSRPQHPGTSATPTAGERATETPAARAERRRAAGPASTSAPEPTTRPDQQDAESAGTGDAAPSRSSGSGGSSGSSESLRHRRRLRLRRRQWRRGQWRGGGSGGSGGGTVPDALKDPVGTVQDVVKDPVGTVTGTVVGVVEDPVGTVDGTVATVTGAVGGLLSGSGSATPTPTPTPTGSGGGLLGGLLGR